MMGEMGGWSVGAGWLGELEAGEKSWGAGPACRADHVRGQRGNCKVEIGRSRGSFREESVAGPPSHITVDSSLEPSENGVEFTEVNECFCFHLFFKELEIRTVGPQK